LLMYRIVVSGVGIEKHIIHPYLKKEELVSLRSGHNLTICNLVK
jgi:hypothetical protein